MTTVTVSTGRTLTLCYSGFPRQYAAGATVSIPTFMVPGLQAAGVVN